MKPRKMLTVFAAMLLTAAVASPSYAQTVQTAQRGGVFVMPAGDHAAAATGAVAAALDIRTRVPGGDGALLALKNQSTGMPLAPAADAESAPVEVTIRAGVAEGGPLFPSTQCNTNIATGFAPSDIHGAAGPGVLVVVTNVDIGVYNKSTCAIISRVSLKTLFAGFGDIENQTLFDPRVIYDRAAGRFMVTAESTDNRTGNTDQFQYFAVSTSSAASGWNRYRFMLSEGANRFCKRATNSFWDYPSVGKSANRWFIAANDFVGTSAAGAILSIDKAPTLTGAATSARCFASLQSNIAPPIVLDSLTTQSVFLYPRSTFIGRYNHSAGATVGADTLVAGPSYPIAAWTVPPDAVQPNGQKLDSLDGRFQSASIQSRDRIWNIHTINNGGSPAIRWYRLQRTASTVLSTHTFVSGHLFNPSFVTGSGLDGAPAFITASRTIPTCSTATCLASMLLYSGPNNTSTTGWAASIASSSTSQFATTNGTTPCNSDSRGSCRWGDYSSITVDPNEAGRAWGFNQLINGPRQFDWFTRGRMEIYNLQN